MLVLGIETTCDETSVAIVKDGREILSCEIFSQSEIQKEFGGVFPELAARKHLEIMIPVLESALRKANISKNEIDLIAVAQGPGLIGSLLVGINTAKTLSLSLNIPIIGVNHVYAHLYAAMMQEMVFPSLGVVLSGGHTLLMRIESPTEYYKISSTVDDAIGEAFDKVARFLDLPYPGGPIIEKLAQKGNSSAFTLRAGNVKGRPLDFSFSGLKTNVLYTTQKMSPEERQKALPDLAASFQHVAFQDICHKMKKALDAFTPKAIYFGGGVTQNQYLRDMIQKNFCDPIYWPTKELCLDNAAMIAGLGYQMYIQKKSSDTLDFSPYTIIAF